MTDFETLMSNLARLVAASGTTMRDLERDAAHLPADCLTNDELVTRIDQAWRDTHPEPRRPWIHEDDRRLCDPPTTRLWAEPDAPEPFIPRYAQGDPTR